MSATRNPKFISDNAEGLQITVAGSGVTSQTIYADVSGSSPLCTTSNSIETCVLNVPTLTASEQLTALEVDELPTGENSSGYGTGFPSGSNILGGIGASATVQLGASNAIGLQLGPVIASFYDCSPGLTPPTALPQTYSTNFGIDGSGVDNAGSGYNRASRIVVTAGVASTGSIVPFFYDPSGDCEFYDTTPAPIVDVNGSPTPITLTSNFSGLTLAPIVSNGTAPPASAYVQNASISSEAYFWYDCFISFVGVKASASLASPATIVLSNNLTALNPYLTPPSSYAGSWTYTVVPISVSPTTATVSQASGTAMVTGSDYGAYHGMGAASSYANEQYGDYNCNTSGGTTLATVGAGALNTTNWTQPFTITGSSNGTGTCTFYLYDKLAGTVTQAVTVTVN